MRIFIDESVIKFIDGLEKPTISKVTRMIDLLETFGNNLALPYSKKLSADLFELRVRGQQEVRILYTFYKGSVVLLHGFIKKTQKTPLREIEVAQSKRKALTKI